MSSAASGPNASSPEAGDQAVRGPDGLGTTLPGTVYLVGAGPGDPDLLTLKAHRLLSRCDALVYDSLVPRALLDLVPEGCECHFVGKRRGHHSVPQRTTNAVLVELAQRHRCIVRLKGGDPFLFGRGGEEAAHLVKQGVAVQVVPGVTAGIAAPAYAGIPVTHRRAGSSRGPPPAPLHTNVARAPAASHDARPPDVPPHDPVRAEARHRPRPRS